MTETPVPHRAAIIAIRDETDIVVGQITEVVQNEVRRLSQLSLERLSQQSSQYGNLIQALGIALRDILPYAENEVTGLGAIVSDDPETNGPMYDEASERLQRAQQLYSYLSHDPVLNVVDCKSNAFDGTFTLRFE